MDDLIDEFITASEWSKECLRAMLEIRFVAVPLGELTDSKALLNKVVQRIF